MSCSLTLKNISVLKEEKCLFKNVTLTVSHKEKIAIIGPNGSGKTTLLESIAGLSLHHEGIIELFHQPMLSLKDFKPMRHLIGYLFQDSDNQFLAPIVEDDVAFSLLAQGFSKEEANLKTQMLLQDLGISHLSKKVVYHLSGGEKKLVALAGVLISEPKLMLLDEPTNGLDLKMQLRLVEILEKIDKSIIVVSHHHEFIESLVDTIYTLSPNGLECMVNKKRVCVSHYHTHEDGSVHYH